MRVARSAGIGVPGGGERFTVRVPVPPFTRKTRPLRLVMGFAARGAGMA